MGSWDVWRDAERRERLIVRTVPLPDEAGGGLHALRDRRSVILIDRDLHAPRRDEVLGHELVHQERGGGVDTRGMPASWDAVASREEQRVWRITAERFVPAGDLQRFCDREADLGHGVGPDDVAREFDVTWQVACLALENLARYERRSPT